MYPQQITPVPQYSFLGGPSPNVFPRLSPDDAAKLAGLDVKQVIDDVLYDTKSWVAGTAVGTANVDFFSIQQNSTDAVANSASVTYTKDESYTNLVQGGSLEKGEAFIAESMQAVVVVPGNLDLTLQASGNTTRTLATGTFATLDATHSGIVASTLAAAILRYGTIRLKIGPNSRLEGGPLIHFPSAFGISGAGSNLELGTVTAGSNISANDMIFQNGFGRERFFRTPRVISAGQNFYVRLNFWTSFNPGRNFDVQICLKGFRLRDVA